MSYSPKTSTLSSQPSSENTTSISSQKPLITINVNAQLPIKLTPNNYPSWRAQFNSLLLGHNLYGYIDGSVQAPQPLTKIEGSSILVPNSSYEHWYQQDQLLLHGIIASASENVVPFIASCESSIAAWEKLAKMYANKSRSRMMNLREKLANPKGNKTVSEYFQLLRTTADDLALINKPVNEEELVIHALNGIGSDFRKIAAGVRARESDISFEELLDKFLDYEGFLKKQDVLNESIIPSANFAAKGKPMNRSVTYVNRNNNSQGNQRRSNVVCQFCEKVGHSAKLCYKIKNNKKPSPSANYAASKDSTWLMDSGSTHHVTSDLNKLKLHREYEGTDSLTIGDGLAFEEAPGAWGD